MSEQRFEITVGFGPCTSDEAEAFLERIGAAIYGGLCGDTLGAVCALGPWDGDDE